MTPDLSHAELPEDTAVENASRWPLLFLAGSGVVWLLVSGVGALLASIQMHTPAFLADCPLLTIGHLQALQETAFVYGWIGNVGLALVLWILVRLSGEPLRASHWVVAGTAFWNLGVLLALIGVAVGGATEIPFLEIPGAIQPLLLASYGAIAVGGVLAWAGRRRDMMFAAQWYAIAALFLFPWVFSAAHVMLVLTPLRGVVQAVAAGWFAQSLWTLWIVPLALAGAYYVVPRVSGKTLPGYDVAALGFWALLFLGGFTGGRHLIGGPVPAWIATLAVVTSFGLLVHYIIVLLNLRDAFRTGGVAMRLIGFGLMAYLLGGVLDAVSSLHFVAAITQFTFVDQAQRILALDGGVTLILFGCLYFALPRIAGRPWASAGLVRGHMALSLVGVAVLVVCLVVGGWIQGNDLNRATVSFPEMAAHIRPWLVGASMGEAIFLLGNLLLAFNFFRTIPAARDLIALKEAYVS